ncbi:MULTISPECIES: c-type cytochrome [Salegentibacter]|uniref:Cytochrome c n=1 Tax=Salegentibacter maritimus TaxID=2794347 RepID=A0ABS0TDZ7_9FLAO|nr:MULTISPECIES: cytochrome c [Salegentibacter]MBE7640743.1 c-type cytochrome [Salegentibacter sp. BLCTC]MBI6117126.1 cytochrome c [Salegentibacter maritimus]MBI6119271.1 cytochrome c [Salegentibacter maritimus]
MKNLFYKAIVLFLVGGVVMSCADSDKPNYQYMPDMYKPVGYETYGEYDIFENGQEAKLPVEGTIPRGWMPYDYEDSPEGLANAKANLNNPLPYTEDNLNEGKALYTIYCAVCHGDNGDGKGILTEREKILGVPSYDDVGRAITEGSVYHVIYYGLNSMGSYAVQTSEEERWKITHYVMNLKNELEGGEEIPFEEVKEASVAEANPVEVDRAQQNAQEAQGEGAALTVEEENNN